MYKIKENVILIIFIVIFTFTISFWLQQEEELALGKDFSLFLSCFSSFDHFVFSGIVIFLVGIIFIFTYLMVNNALFKHPRIILLILWTIFFPIFILIGVVLFRAGLFAARTDWMYLLLVSYILGFFLLRKKSLPILSTQFWMPIIIVYVILLVGVCLPNKQFDRIFKRERTNYVFKIDELDLLCSMTTNKDTVIVKIGKDLQSKDSTFVFAYFPVDCKEKIEDKSILFLQYDNQIRFMPDNGIEINVTNWAFYEAVDDFDVINDTNWLFYKAVDDFDVMDKNADFEFLISSHDLFVMSREQRYYNVRKL